MTLLDALHTPLREPLMTASMILVLLEGQLFLMTVRTRKERALRACSLVFFLAGFALFFLVLDSDYYLHPLQDHFAWFGVTKWFLGAPALVPVLWEAASALVLAAAFCGMIRYRSRHLSPESVKEAMDHLPVGISFENAAGQVVFQNLKMAELPADRVWHFAEEKTELEGEVYRQKTAADITEETRVTAELEEKNARLKDLKLRLRIYNEQADRMIIQKEMLSARVAVHNEVSNVLLESRRYLEQPDAIDTEVLIRALKNANTYLLKEFEADDAAGDPLLDALEMAGAIGVEVTLAGPVPSQHPARRILAQAIYECAVNTVKHGEGDRLTVETGREEDRWRFAVTGSGRPPEGTIRESGGLAQLRALAEQYGGIMRTEGGEAFRLRIILE